MSGILSPEHLPQISQGLTERVAGATIHSSGSCSGVACRTNAPRAITRGDIERTGYLPLGRMTAVGIVPCVMQSGDITVALVRVKAVDIHRMIAKRLAVVILPLGGIG